MLLDMFITVLTLIRMKARKAKGEKPLFTLTGGHFCLADRMTRMASTASAASVKVTKIRKICTISMYSAEH